MIPARLARSALGGLLAAPVVIVAWCLLGAALLWAGL